MSVCVSVLGSVCLCGHELEQPKFIQSLQSALHSYFSTLTLCYGRQRKLLQQKQKDDVPHASLFCLCGCVISGSKGHQQAGCLVVA